MNKFTSFVLVVLLVMVSAASAFAHSGAYTLDEYGDPIGKEIIVSGVTTDTHNETIGNTQNWYKGWWFVTLTNSTGVDWNNVKIQAGVGNQVAIVEGAGLQDEWGFASNSVTSNKAGTVAYAGSYGSKVYNFGGPDITGNLWQSAVYTFTTPIADTQKVAFKVYTDNSYYGGTPASSFQLTITPNAVPEPSSLLAISTSLLGLAGFALRKRS